ncbi:phage tail protein [Paractinoplanes durhamensis]|uniref:Phage tail protein n=1 Tax=Paractinoplanes durhamensis TaxID=113563 RepID=A0ABQ3Z754_9ACTN|nr:phage tail protein [Actinoplanes durhamensis]GIE05675.1 phage tail protein [Actinoplanes durhamensis]
MARFTVNANRFDPYLGFKFKVKWDGHYIAALNKCSALKRTTEVTPWYEGGDSSGPHQLPGKSKYDPVTLEAGVTHDTAFEEWANKVNNFAAEATMSLAGFRKDITIEVFNQQGSKVLAYNVFRCWVSEYTALPQLDAAANAVMITSIKLENEGWVRDLSVVEPRETT